MTQTGIQQDEPCVTSYMVAFWSALCGRNFELQHDTAVWQMTPWHWISDNFFAQMLADYGSRHWTYTWPWHYLPCPLRLKLRNIYILLNIPVSGSSRLLCSQHPFSPMLTLLWSYLTLVHILRTSSMNQTDCHWTIIGSVRSTILKPLHSLDTADVPTFDLDSSCAAVMICLVVNGVRKKHTIIHYPSSCNVHLFGNFLCGYSFYCT